MGRKGLRTKGVTAALLLGLAGGCGDGDDAGDASDAGAPDATIAQSVLEQLAAVVRKLWLLEKP